MIELRVERKRERERRLEVAPIYVSAIADKLALNTSDKEWSMTSS